MSAAWRRAMPAKGGKRSSRTAAAVISGVLAGCAHAINPPAYAMNAPGSALPAVTSPASLSVKVEGNHLVDGNGAPLQLRGVSVSGLEFVAVQGWSPANPWGATRPDWGAIRKWSANAVRIPLNEASWLGYSCVDGKGATRNPDPGHNYKKTVAETVQQATAAGLYVVLDLHWSAPEKYCPLLQNPMADADHSIDFWSSVATQFKGSPNVLFELFNEPFVGYGGPVSAADWRTTMRGGAMRQFLTVNPTTQGWDKIDSTWQVAGMQQMLDAVRATGATNVVLAGTPSWSQDISQWIENAPRDPLHQLGVAWHPYPNSNAAGDPQALVPKLGPKAYEWAEHILAADYPILITETGDHNAPGTRGSPYLANLLPWADAHGISYFGWGWNVWGDKDNVLIKDASGTPTDGYGVEFKRHLASVARTVSSSR